MHMRTGGTADICLYKLCYVGAVFAFISNVVQTRGVADFIAIDFKYSEEDEFMHGHFVKMKWRKTPAEALSKRS